MSTFLHKYRCNLQINDIHVHEHISIFLYRHSVQIKEIQYTNQRHTFYMSTFLRYYRSKQCTNPHAKIHKTGLTHVRSFGCGIISLRLDCTPGQGFKAVYLFKYTVSDLFLHNNHF